MIRLLPAMLALPLVGCSNYLVQQLDGVWAGTATDQTNTPVVMTADFTWDDEEQLLGGQVDIGGWIYLVYAANSDNEYANVEMWLNTAARKVDLNKVGVDKEAMGGEYVVNTCWSEGGQTLDDPALCLQTGSFDLEKQ
ncbi:MAG: hypothetical protein KTR31_22165 [Myxococcales bacterium]|nr:hypothetical protein [Myxococcales bacterium]